MDDIKRTLRDEAIEDIQDILEAERDALQNTPENLLETDQARDMQFNIKCMEAAIGFLQMVK